NAHSQDRRGDQSYADTVHGSCSTRGQRNESSSPMALETGKVEGSGCTHCISAIQSLANKTSNFAGAAPGKCEPGATVPVVMNDSPVIAQSIAFESDT